jgi:hypothetical protein
MLDTLMQYVLLDCLDSGAGNLRKVPMCIIDNTASEGSVNPSAR